MMYKTLDEILADIGKSNVTPKHLIKAAYDLGAGVEEAVISETLTVEEVEEVEEEEEELDTSTPN